MIFDWYAIFLIIVAAVIFALCEYAITRDRRARGRSRDWDEKHDLPF